MTVIGSSAPVGHEAFQDLPFTAWIGAEDLAILCRYASQRRVGDGEFLWREGEINDDLVFLLSGRIKLLKDTAVRKHPIVLGLFGAGALISDASFAAGHARSTSAAVMENSQVLLLSRESFENLAAEHPFLANRILSEALLSSTDQLQHAHGRLAAIF